MWAVAALGGCGGARRTTEPIPQPTPIGRGRRYVPPSLGHAAAAARPIAGLRCTRRPSTRFGAHLELFVRGRVVLVPAGVGIAAPRQEQGAYVRGGRCSYALRTREPTGVIEVSEGTHPTLADFFAVWGEPLRADDLAGFRARSGEHTRAWVGGRAHGGDPRRIPLSRHAQIVVELGAYVPPHAAYRFPAGL